MILPVSGGFEAKEHGGVCECLTTDHISKLVGEKFNMDSESNDVKVEQWLRRSLSVIRIVLGSPQKSGIFLQFEVVLIEC